MSQLNIFLQEVKDMKQSKFKKKYKALMLDVDGTIIMHSREEILPSKKVRSAINNAAGKIHIGLATSRPFSYTSYLIEHLKLSSPCIVTGGAQIYDPLKKTVVFETCVEKSAVKEIYKIAKKYKIKILDDGRGMMATLKEKDVKNPTQFWLEGVYSSDADNVISELSNVPTISVQKAISRFRTDGRVDVLVSHVDATKQHGILKVAEILGIETHDIIGVGDGYNDFPLLMACGLKVAMGNAVDDLKEIADYIAPSVEQDGVADVIEKFVLKNEKLN